MLDGGGLRGHLAGPGETGIIHGQPHQVELIFAVEDREIGLIAQDRRGAPEDAIADVMEGPGPDLIPLFADQRFEPADHLPRRASGERDEHDRAGRDSHGDQVGDTEGDDSRLSRTGTGQDQVVAVRSRHRGMLRRIQLALKVLGKPGGQRRFEANLPHANARVRGAGSGRYARRLKGIIATRPGDCRSLPEGSLRDTWRASPLEDAISRGIPISLVARPEFLVDDLPFERLQ